jgi:hypothetical protein
MSTRKTGKLKKEGGSNKTWHERFMELTGAGLHYYTSEDKKKFERRDTNVYYH